MTTDSIDLQLHDFVTDYTGWPLTCVYCGHDKVIYSAYQQDARCQCCGKWQLTEEEENGKGS